MNILKINLNLLKVFIVLMREQHVSSAAKNLNLTQSAISNSLQQLREIFQDELLIRGTKKMVPTKRALLLAPKIEAAICQLEESIFEESEFDFATSEREFFLGMTDYAEYILLPKIYEKLKIVAPFVSLRVLTYHKFLPENFEEGNLDLGIGLEESFPKILKSEKLYSDYAVCVARSDHPIFKKKLTQESYFAAEHLGTCIYSEWLSRTDLELKRIGLERNIKLTLPNALPALQILSTSDLIGTISKNLAAQSAEKYKLKYVPLPFSMPEYHISQIWHRQQHNDSGLIWLRNLIKEIVTIILNDSRYLK